MKPAILRPQAMRDRQIEVRYYREVAGAKVPVRLVKAANAALDQIELDPGIGSPVVGKTLGITGLRTWRVSGFPLVWFYFERDDHLDVVRMLGERQDIATIIGA
ncbi:MAG: type II toxin-antitoxin system RelE/ParE family toxin [Burkholderiales bacterium]|nr:type II toxin-antitoxin system RelE/ParE family toxin [Burkholderiales bacterium]